MKAAVFNGKKLEIKEKNIPKIDNNFVLVKILTAGVCGTDLAIVKGFLPTPTPIILGHEIIGIVEKIGPKANKIWLGKRVAIEINARIDHTCYYCKKGEYTQCISRKALGIDIDGGFAEYIVVEEYLLHELPDTISDLDATFIEPLAAAYQTFEMMPINNNDKNMVIFGLGKLGLLILQVAISKGLKVYAIDGSKKKLELASKFGAEIVINRFTTENIPEVIKELTDGLGADIGIDTSANPEVIPKLLESVRTRGKIHMKSTHGLQTPINITDMVVREITMYTSRCGPFEKAILGLKSGKIKVKDLISGVFSLEEIEKAIEAYNNRDFIKAVIQISDLN